MSALCQNQYCIGVGSDKYYVPGSPMYRADLVVARHQGQIVIQSVDLEGYSRRGCSPIQLSEEQQTNSRRFTYYFARF